MVAAVGAAVAAVFSMRARAQKGLAPSCLAVLHPYGSPPAFFEATAGADRPASGRIWSPSPPPQLPTVARLAGALGHRRAAFDGDARQPWRHATPASKARWRHQLQREGEGENGFRVWGGGGRARFLCGAGATLAVGFHPMVRDDRSPAGQAGRNRCSTFPAQAQVVGPGARAVWRCGITGWASFGPGRKVGMAQLKNFPFYIYFSGLHC